MSFNLDDLISQFKESDQKKTSFSGGDWYPFWKMDFDQTATFRFLPDGDPNASHFLVEKWQHRLDVTIDGKTEQRSIPCLAQYGKNCPVCNVAKKFYDDKDDDNGSRFYKKRSWIGQGIVVDSPFDYEDPDKQPKLISIGWQIYSSIKTAIMQRDVECLPTDYEKGYNLRITKTRQGTRANYSNSRFAPHPSAVDPDLLKEVELYILKDKLPREPDLKNVEAMLSSALTGEPYTPPGRSNQESTSTPDAGFTTPDRSTPDVVDAPAKDLPWEDSTPDVKTEPVVEAAPAGETDADEILAAIARRKAERSD